MGNVTSWDRLGQGQGSKQGSSSHNTCSYWGMGVPDCKEDLDGAKTVYDPILSVL